MTKGYIVWYYVGRHQPKIRTEQKFIEHTSKVACEIDMARLSKLNIVTDLKCAKYDSL
jgi:hypothetical protein